MSDDIVARLRGQRTNSVLCEEAADEIERLREWKELAYTIRNKSWWAMRKSVLMKFEKMHKDDWKLKRV